MVPGNGLLSLFFQLVLRVCVRWSIFYRFCAYCIIRARVGPPFFSGRDKTDRLTYCLFRFSVNRFRGSCVCFCVFFLLSRKTGSPPGTSAEDAAEAECVIRDRPVQEVPRFFRRQGTVLGEKPAPVKTTLQLSRGTRAARYLLILKLRGTIVNRTQHCE